MSTFTLKPTMDCVRKICEHNLRRSLQILYRDFQNLNLNIEILKLMVSCDMDILEK